jgi:uncharacterized protein YbbC (DUF1343 family)
MNFPIPGVVPFLESPPVSKKAKLGLATNQAARLPDGTLSRVSILKAGFSLHRLFSPEHGLEALGADGKPQPSGIDPLTGIPVESLYHQEVSISANQLQGLDAVLFDIPDAGARFYTYLWTMTHLMEACAGAQIPFVVLDRPNPLGGNLAYTEGPMLDEAHCSSFIGRWSIPIRHSCTLGELARYFLSFKKIKLDLRVVPCRCWNRKDPPDFSKAWFIKTSPAIVDAETALLYCGTAFFEAFHVNEGRGTAHPFKQVGAPWILPGEKKNRRPGIYCQTHFFHSSAWTVCR